jgi:hypothetical protein
MSNRKYCAALLFLLIVSAIALWPVYGGWGAPAEAVHPSSSFTPPVNLSNSPGYPYAGSAHIVRAADGCLHVAWWEGNDGAGGPAYTKKCGTSWQPWEWIAPPTGPTYSDLVLAVDNAGSVHVAMSQGQTAPYLIVYTSKPVTGSWSLPVSLSLGLPDAYFPTIAVDSQGGVWVAWQSPLSDTNSEIYARYRPAGGDWDTLMRVTDNTVQDEAPSLAVGSGDVAHLAWHSYSTGNWDILYSRYEAGSWTPAENVSNTPSRSYLPDLAADGAGNVFVAWADEIDGPNHSQVLCRRWDGSTWLPWTQVSSSTKALYPAIAADDSGNLYAVWTDYRGAQPETYFSYSTDYGATWLGDENVSNSAASSYYPDVAAQPGGCAHVVWQDASPGQLDIFYSQGRVPAFAGEWRFYLPLLRK